MNLTFLPETSQPIKIENLAQGLTIEQIIREVQNHGGSFSMDTHTLVDFHTKAIYATGDGVLPEAESIILVARVKDPKGNSERDYLYSSIKEIIIRDGEPARAYFSEGIGYTNKKTDLLRDLVANYSGPVSAETNNTASVHRDDNNQDSIIQKARAFQSTFNPNLFKRN